MSDPKPAKQKLPDASHVSEATRRLNPHIWPSGQDVTRAEVIANHVPEPPKLKRKRRRVMNGTEQRFADVLEAMKRKGEIDRFGFEEMTLRWGNDEVFSYTPDFTVHTLIPDEDPGTSPHMLISFREVKGAHIREKDWMRFKAARDNFPWFDFELWQWKEHTWTRLT